MRRHGHAAGHIVPGGVQQRDGCAVGMTHQHRARDAQLREHLRWLGSGPALSLAASLAFVRLAGESGALSTLADAKLLLDMQAIVTARQAAVIAGV